MVPCSRSTCSVQASHYGLLLLQSMGSGASELQHLQHVGSVVAGHRLGDPQHVESSRSCDWIHVPCIGRQRLNHQELRYKILWYTFYYRGWGRDRTNFFLNICILTCNWINHPFPFDLKYYVLHTQMSSFLNVPSCFIHLSVPGSVSPCVRYYSSLMSTDE